MPAEHSTVMGGKRYVWFTERLCELAKGLSPFEIEVSAVKELDEDCWFGKANRRPTLREIAHHCDRSALKFYRRIGFAVCGETATHFQMESSA